MKTEVEARLLEVNVESFLSKLKSHDALFVGDWLQMRKCYDFNPVKPNSWIRLRTNGIETTLTIKEIIDSSIEGTKECEIVVSDFNVCEEMLNKLGYFARSNQENRRIRYILDGVEIDIDFWPYIPTYVEFEGESKEDIMNVCEKLDVPTEKLVSIDVEGIYKMYGLKSDVMNNMSLEEDRKKQGVK